MRGRGIRVGIDGRGVDGATLSVAVVGGYTCDLSGLGGGRVLLCSLLLSRGSMSAADEVHESVDKSGADEPEGLWNGRIHAGNYTRRCGLLGLGRLNNVRARALLFCVFGSALQTALVGEAARRNTQRV